ncbi:MAG: hypothetical protein QOH65_671 [Methylobacteriaceae bacterium]|nr:hypothetical protein [Methylobacteriaceae bacterium]
MLPQRQKWRVLHPGGIGTGLPPFYRAAEKLLRFRFQKMRDQKRNRTLARRNFSSVRSGIKTALGLANRTGVKCTRNVNREKSVLCRRVREPRPPELFEPHTYWIAAKAGGRTVRTASLPKVFSFASIDRAFSVFR